MLSSTSRARFVTVCQQLLALAVVLAFLTPAARTITMDVRPPSHGGAGGDVQKIADDGLTAPAGARLSGLHR